MANDIKTMPTGNVQIAQALRTHVTPKLDEIMKELAELKKLVNELKPKKDK